VEDSEQQRREWEVPVVRDRQLFFDEESRFADPDPGAALPAPDDPEKELRRMREEAKRRTESESP
jgi:hypothetical protein